MDSMHTFLDQVIDQKGDARHAIINLDFADLQFVDPTGVVVLSNLIEYLRGVVLAA